MTGSARDRRRTRLLVALVLAGVALVGLAAGYLLSLGGGLGDAGAAGDSGVRTPSTRPTTGTASAPAATSPRPTVRAASEIERGRTRDLGYLLGARTLTDGLHVTFDRVQELTGTTAQAYARGHGIDSASAARGIIINENPRTRDLVLAPDVAVYGGVRLAASSDLERIPLQTLLDALATDGGSIPLGLTYDRLGYIVKIEEKRFG